ncbi:Hypothetical Protein FCC1311_023982 [Hondaea fermentalgiana]|uniref:Uncharacterized protein n=1 Tax=Hondaea fermentalgiana TaxID=2315210 RepID=A0A2R5G567_9STRA|nr:Hypothetical Protein FCC1311_023982 [Hondaea fermentalgiana]|eukprot:GBG26177.1 Hypothetical Protein FCC1311_023982 [Hondaea fermentalgiana]
MAGDAAAAQRGNARDEIEDDVGDGFGGLAAHSTCDDGFGEIDVTIDQQQLQQHQDQQHQDHRRQEQSEFVDDDLGDGFGERSDDEVENHDGGNSREDATHDFGMEDLDDGFCPGEEEDLDDGFCAEFSSVSIAGDGFTFPNAGVTDDDGFGYATAPSFHRRIPSSPLCSPGIGISVENGSTYNHVLLAKGHGPSLEYADDDDGFGDSDIEEIKV